MNYFKAGVKQYDITPPMGVRLAGYPHFPRENTGAHDPLFATAFYLTNGENECVFVTLDILFFSKKYANEIRSRVNRASSIPEKQILISCSHTHSGPWAAGNCELEATAGDSEDIDPAYLADLLDNITCAILEAKASAFAAEIGFGEKHCGAEVGIGGNRRAKNGLADPWINVIAIREKGGRVRGILTNYALHPTFLHEDSSLVSADYPCYLRRELSEMFDGALVGFAQGASGDQSSRYFRQGQSFDEAERVGRIMGKMAAEAIANMIFTDTVTLRHEMIELPIPIREYPPIEELEEKVRVRTEIYNRLIADGASYLDIQNANLRVLGAEDMLGYAICVKNGKRIDLRDDENPAEVSVFAINDHVLVSSQGEVFVEYGLRIRKESPASTTFFLELANGCLPGYCVNDDAYVEDGYEAGNCMLAPGFGDTIADVALSLIHRVLA